MSRGIKESDRKGKRISTSIGRQAADFQTQDFKYQIILLKFENILTKKQGFRF